VDRIARVRAAVAGEAVDYPPFSVWYHFGLQHAPAERSIRAHLEFLGSYDLDLLKVMNDYGYPMPEGVDAVSDAVSLERLVPVPPERGELGRQLEVIAGLAEACRGQLLIVDTIFDAWSTLRRSVVRGAMASLMADHPIELERALRVVNNNLIRYAQSSLDRGASGIFLSVPAAPEFVTPLQYERFVRPFDLALLDGLRGKGECHILHAHGSRPYLDRLLDYPVHVFSWADRDGGPSLAEIRERTSRALMGGMSHVRLSRMSAPEVRAQVLEARACTSDRRLLLAPGCSLPTSAPVDLIRAARDAAREAQP
jgi:uroporphyrinogen decarboxylase